MDGANSRLNVHKYVGDVHPNVTLAANHSKQFLEDQELVAN